MTSPDEEGGSCGDIVIAETSQAAERFISERRDVGLRDVVASRLEDVLAHYQALANASVDELRSGMDQINREECEGCLKWVDDGAIKWSSDAKKALCEECLESCRQGQDGQK